MLHQTGLCCPVNWQEYWQRVHSVHSVYASTLAFTLSLSHPSPSSPLSSSTPPWSPSLNYSSLFCSFSSSPSSLSSLFFLLLLLLPALISVSSLIYLSPLLLSSYLLFHLCFSFPSFLLFFFSFYFSSIFSFFPSPSPSPSPVFFHLLLHSFPSSSMNCFCDC